MNILKVVSGHGGVSVGQGKGAVPHDALKGEHIAPVPEIVHGKATAEAVWPVPLHSGAAAKAFQPFVNADVGIRRLDIDHEQRRQTR